MVKGGVWNIISLGVGSAANGHVVLQSSTVGLNLYAGVFGEFLVAVVLVVPAVGLLGVLAIYKTDIAAAEDVAIALRHTFESADGSVVYVDIGLAEDETVGIASGLILSLPVVEATAAAKDITQHMTAHHGDVGLTRLVYRYLKLVGRILGLCASSDSSNLAAAIHAVADDAVPKGDIGNVHITVGSIAATKGIACLKHNIVAYSILVNLFHEIVILAA